MRKYELSAAEAALAFKQVSSHCEALKNWATSAVEGGKFEYAEKLVKELREYQRLYAKLNVESHKMIDAALEA